MIHSGAQPLHAGCDELLESLCRMSTEPCALLDGLGRVIVASELFRAISQAEEGLAALLVQLQLGATSTTPAWADDGWLVGRAVPVEGSEQVLVHLFGPAVVKARLALLLGRSLSTREAECLSIALGGEDNSSIAKRLGVRPETVKVHLRNAYRKLGASGRADLLARLVQKP